MDNQEIKEFHLFAGIGGGIYGGELLGHKCCGGVEIDEYCKKVLKQRQIDGKIEDIKLSDAIISGIGNRTADSYFTTLKELFGI